MEATADTSITYGTAAVPAHGQGSGPPPLYDPSATIMELTWLVFGVISFILYKVAWKPILKALDEREESIRTSLEDAACAREELVDIGAKIRTMIAEARAKSDTIVTAAREEAERSAASIQEKAREQARNSMDAAAREIDNATRRARESLQAETADLALLVAGKLLRETMDSAAHRSLAARLAEEMRTEERTMGK